MNTGQRTIATVLALVASLLVLNLVVKGTAPARAGQVATVQAQPTLVDGEYDDGLFWRFFSDGTVDVTSFGWGTFPANCVPIDPPWCDPGDEGPHVVLPPAAPPGSPGPTVVAGRWQLPRLLRFWSDGSVDVTSIQFASDTHWCVPVPMCLDPGPFQVIGPAPYPSCAPFDSDLDGTVGITDFLTLLANWGPCP
jgi:hypothetical protein